MLTNFTESELAISDNYSNKSLVVIHSKSRREKKVASYCNNSGIKFYLPLEKKIKSDKNKKLHSLIPLFPGYLFCIADEKERYLLFLTHQIAQIFKVSNQSGLLRDLEKIFTAEKNDSNLSSCEIKTEGRKARIISGPMKGLEGIISSIKDKDHIVLNVDFLSRAALVDISCSDITLIN